MLKAFTRWLFEHSEDNARQIDDTYLVTGPKGRSTTLRIHHAIEKILKQHAYAKIGKSVQPDARLKKADYRPYQTMYLVYETTSSEYISHYERYFINSFYDRLDNKHDVSSGRIAKVKSKSYLYVVVAD